jgi:hypothetical protein
MWDDVTAETPDTFTVDTFDKSNPASANSPVARCRKALQKASRAALPPLAGYVNTRVYIARLTHALLTQVIRHNQAGKFLAAAKVALGILPCEPNSSSRSMDLQFFYL